MLRLIVAGAPLLLAACSSDSSDSGDSASDESFAGNRRLAEVRTVFSDGRTDVLSYQYDAEGFPASYSLTSEGRIDQQATYFVDADGLVERLETDMTGDGTVDHVAQYRYENGRLGTRDIDSDNDGVFDFTQVSLFDDQGRYLGYIAYSLDAAGQQQAQVGSETITYPDPSLIVSERYSGSAQDTADTRIEYTLSPTGEYATSTENYYSTVNGLTSVTDWIYEDAACDKRWQGVVYNRQCVSSAE